MKDSLPAPLPPLLAAIHFSVSTLASTPASTVSGFRPDLDSAPGHRDRKASLQVMRGQSERRCARTTSLFSNVIFQRAGPSRRRFSCGIPAFHVELAQKRAPGIDVLREQSLQNPIYRCRPSLRPLDSQMSIRFMWSNLTILPAFPENYHILGLKMAFSGLSESVWS